MKPETVKTTTMKTTLYGGQGAFTVVNADLGGKNSMPESEARERYIGVLEMLGRGKVNLTAIKQAHERLNAAVSIATARLENHTIEPAKKAGKRLFALLGKDVFGDEAEAVSWAGKSLPFTSAKTQMAREYEEQRTALGVCKKWLGEYNAAEKSATCAVANRSASEFDAARDELRKLAGI